MSMNEPFVTITTATFNSEQTLARTIQSVLDQTFTDIEYIIMDGQSKDRTLEIAKGFEPLFAAKGIPYRIISEPDNGMYDAINKAISLANGKIIGNVNSDDFYEPSAVETVVREFKKEPFDMIYGNLRIIKDTGNFIKKAKYKRMAFTRYWNHPTTFITREVLQTRPYACESMYDDCDLMLRLRRQGCRIRVVDQVLSNFTFGGMSTRKNWKETRERIRIRNDIYRKNGYGVIYCIDGWLIETMKYLLG